MKIFGYEFRKFEQDTTTIEMVETWCVKWSSLHRDIIDVGRQKIEVQAFPTKEGAEFFAKELRDARKLLGDTKFGVKVYKQDTPTNA